MIRSKSGWRTFVEGLLIGAIVCWPGAAFLMLSIGIVHAEVLPSVQPVGYWPCFALFWTVSAALSAIRAKPDNWEVS